VLSKLKRLYGDRRGITGVETAIILIALVVVASVFAYTVISAGMFSSQKEKEALHAGLEEARTLMVPKGDVTAYKYSVDTNGDNIGDTDGVVKVSFAVTNGLAELPIDLTPAWQLNGTNGNLETSGLLNPVVVSFSDNKQLIEDAAWTVSFSGKSNGDNVLESEEKAEITVWVSDYQYDAVQGLHYSLGAGPADPFIDAAADLLGARDRFTMQIKGEKGATVDIERVLPVRLDTVMDLS
jgi:flagellin FlaB